MGNPLKLLKAITCCKKPKTSDVQHSSPKYNNAHNVTITYVENPSIDRNDVDDARMDHVDMPHGEHLVLPPTLMDDDFMWWYKEYCKKVDQILARDNLHILNAKQCQHLVKKVKYVVDWILKEIYSFGHVEEFECIWKDVHRLVLKAFSLVKECGGEDLCVLAIFQVENEESFRELLLELESCFKAMYVKIQSKNKINSIDFGMASNEDVQCNRENFKGYWKVQSLPQCRTSLLNLRSICWRG